MPVENLPAYIHELTASLTELAVFVMTYVIPAVTTVVTVASWLATKIPIPSKRSRWYKLRSWLGRLALNTGKARLVDKPGGPTPSSIALVPVIPAERQP